MRTTPGATLALLTSLALLAGCGRDGIVDTGTRDAARNRLAVAADDPAARGVIRGLLAGVAETYPLEEPVAGATVEVFRYDMEPAAGGDSMTVQRTSVGTLVTDAEGRFEITKVPAGNYNLSVIPPIGSPWYGTEAFTVASTGDNDLRVHVLLQRLPAEGGGDASGGGGDPGTGGGNGGGGGAPGDSLGVG